MICFVSRGNKQALYNLHEDRVGARRQREDDGKSGEIREQNDCLEFDTVTNTRNTQ